MDAALPEPGDSMADFVYAIGGGQLASDYRFVLWQGLRELLPWLDDEPLAGIVGVRLTHTGQATSLLSRRAKMILRLPARRSEAARRLEGMRLRAGADELAVGPMLIRPLRAAPTIMAGHVLLDGEGEREFARALEGEIREIGANCRPILGRRKVLRLGAVSAQCYPVAIHGCTPAQSMLLQARGIGAERRLGCGIFVPHKTIEAPQ